LARLFNLVLLWKVEAVIFHSRASAA